MIGCAPSNSSLISQFLALAAARRKTWTSRGLHAAVVQQLHPFLTITFSLV
jgi:hypothetical protein